MPNSGCCLTNTDAQLDGHDDRQTRPRHFVIRRAERRIGMPTEAIGICEPTLTEHPFGRGVAWRMAGQPTAHSALSPVTRSCAVTSSSGPDSAHTGAHASGAVPYFPGV